MPLGDLDGALQANYGLLVEPDGGELLRLPQVSTTLSSIKRIGSFQLDDKGALSGKVHETWLGDAAAAQRYELRNRSSDADVIRPIEALAASAFTTSKVSAAVASNLPTTGEPINWDYSIQADNYARLAGDLLLIRPRIIGSKMQYFFEPTKARENIVEFDRPEYDTDTFEIAVPDGFIPDSLPPPVNLDLGAVAYHSTVEFSGQNLRYTRTYEVKQLGVPLEKLGDLRHFYDAILADERSTAVFKRTGS